MTKADVKAEIEQLRSRLAEAEETLEAIRNGRVDALLLEEPGGEQIYTLRDADRPYRLLLQEMNEGAATLMPDGTVLYCNRRFADMLKTSPEKVIGFSIKNFVQSSDRPLWDALIRSGNRGRVKVEIMCLAEDGTQVPVYCSINPIDIDELPCLCLVATDLTEQKRNEEVMASEKLARGILEHAAEVIVVCDESGLITHASRAADEVAGGNVLHRPFGSVFPLVFEDGNGLGCFVSGTDSNGSFETHCLGGKTVQGVEARFLRPDGKRFDLLISAGPLRDSEERVLGCVFTLTDISRLKQAEETQALLAAIVESSDDAIVSKSLDGVVTSWNRGAERLFGYAASEAVGRPITMIIPAERRDEERSILARIRGGEAVEHFDTVRVSKDGRLLDVSLTISPIRDAKGRIVGASKVARDITARRRMEDSLRESEEKLRRQAQELEQQLIASGRLVSLGEITASMAHEFNNPLGIVMGFAEDLLSEKEPSSPDHQALKIIYDESKRCQKIIQDMIEYSRPRRMEMRRTDVGALAEKGLNMVKNQLYKRNIRSAFESEPGMPEVHADSQQIEQVIVNLYLNAIDAMPEGGVLTVRVGRDADARVAVSISDTGFGISPEDMPKIFQPFFSAKKKSGLGLGLPVCRRIIANHGGEIEVASEAGKGTTFKVYLPVGRAPAGAQAGEAGVPQNRLVG